MSLGMDTSGRISISDDRDFCLTSLSFQVKGLVSLTIVSLNNLLISCNFRLEIPSMEQMYLSVPLAFFILMYALRSALLYSSNQPSSQPSFQRNSEYPYICSTSFADF